MATGKIGTAKNGVRQTFPMCNMTSDELWEQIAKEDSKNWGMNTK